VVQRRGRIPLAPAMAALALILAGAGFALARPDAAQRVASIVESPISQRLSTSEGSAQSHIALIQRGVSDATESIPNALIGFGYGNAHLFLQDIFPGNKYGNFHSLYVTMLAESGILAFVLTLILIFTPLVGGGPWRPLIAGAAVFNVFYQTPVEPAF